MADIKRYPVVSHLRADPTAHVQHVSRGQVRHAGTGQAFWFRPLTAALSEIPVDDQEQPLLFHARTRDLQDVTVQATITYRFEDPVLAASRVDFGIDPGSGAWNGMPLERVGGLLTELCQQPALALIATMTIEEMLTEGISAVRDRVTGALEGDPRLAERGIDVGDIRVVAVKAEPEMERALQTPTRERVQISADRATYERRALAVERERAIAENELQNQIELARREEQLVEQRGTNERRRATEQAEADRIEAEAGAARTRLRAAAVAEEERVLGAARADAAQQMGEAEAAAEAARLDAYGSVDQALVLAIALRELAANMPDIEALTVTPDLVTDLARRFGGARPEVAG